MTGYVRQSLADIQTGIEIEALPLNNEFDAIEMAFHATNGHGHTGATGDAPQIDTAGLSNNSVTTSKIVDNNVTLAKIQQIATSRVLGRLTAGTGNVEEITIGTSGTAIPLLSTANTWTLAQTMSAQLSANGNITIDNSNPRIFFNDTNDGGLTTVGPFASGQTFRIEIDEANTISSSQFNIRIDGGSRLTLNPTTLALGTDVAVTWAGTGAATTRSNLGLGTAAIFNTGTSGATIPVLNASNTWSAQQTISAATAVPAIFQRTNSTTNVSTLFQNSDDTGRVYVGQGALNTFAVKGDNNLSSSPWIAVDSTSFVSNVNASFVGTVGVGSTLSVTNTGPTIQLSDTSISNLIHMFRSFSDDVTIDGDVNNVKVNPIIRLRLGGAGIGYVDAAGYFVSQGASGGFASNATVLTADTTFDSNGICMGFNTGPALMSRSLASGSSVLSINRALSNGQLITFRRSATEVGSVVVNTTNTTYNTSSDKRLKQDLRAIDTSILDNIDVWDFEWKTSGERGHGVMAQDVMGLVPDAISYSEDSDMYGADYSKFVPLLIAAVKELRARNGS